jgi:hypothetical protein
MAYTNSAVEWEKLDPDTYERMVSVLLSRLHPDARRTDGAGGDGGKDVWFPTPSGPEIFELKCFTKRMSQSRWRQVTRSLTRAVELDPTSWHLTLPIDFNPTEEAKFASLTSGYPFPCDYRGLNWLDAHMAEYPSVARYFLQGGADKVMELLAELGKEEAGLSGGVPDLTGRLQRLAARADEIDPHYRISFSVDATGSVSLALSPRYPGADADRPITVSTSFVFPNSPEGRDAASTLNDAIRFGTPASIPSEYISAVVIDAPAGMGGEHTGGEIRIGGAFLSGPEFRLNMVLLDPQNRLVGSLLLPAGPRTIGAAGFETTLADPSGAIRCRFRVDTETSALNLRYQIELPPTCLPAVALPALRFLQHFRPPNRLELRLPDGSVIAPTAIIERDAIVPDEYVELVVALDRLQSHGQVYFDLPATQAVEISFVPGSDDSVTLHLGVSSPPSHADNNAD